MTIATDLVSFPRSTETEEALLVYSYEVAGLRKLVTCFPIDKDAVALTMELAHDHSGLIRPRFNLQLDGLPKGGIRGERKIQGRRE